MSNKLISVVVLGALMAAPMVGFSAEQSAMKKTEKYMDDAAVTAKVKAALMKEKDLKSHEISVQTYHGKVQLSGFVDNQKMVDMAGEKAKTVEGVKEVINSLQVK